MDRYGLPENCQLGATVDGSGRTPFLNGVKSSLTCIDDEPRLMTLFPKNGLGGACGSAGLRGVVFAAGAGAGVGAAAGTGAAGAAAALLDDVLAPGVKEDAFGFGLKTKAALFALSFVVGAFGLSELAGAASAAAVDAAGVAAAAVGAAGGDTPFFWAASSAWRALALAGLKGGISGRRGFATFCAAA